MELRFYINDIEIEEPIGFDNFKAKIERTSEHGISAEVSVDTLEFYGEAYTLIREAYAVDIDRQLIFRAEMKCAENGDFVEVYKGVVDLSTYNEKKGDYCSVKCKVGEIGVRTTFNNRADTQVYLNSLKSMDGDVLIKYKNLDREIAIPAKKMILSNYGKIQPVNSINLGASVFDNDATIVLGFDNQICSEIGNLNMMHSTINPQSTSIGTYTFSDNKYDVSSLKIEYEIDVKIKFSNGSSVFKAYSFIMTDDLDIHKGNIVSGNEIHIQDSYSGVINCNKNTKILLGIFLLNFSGDILMSIEENSNNYFRVSSLTDMPQTSAKISLIHETFSRISEIISGLSVISDWYGRKDSEINPISEIVGGGALKSIINGLKLRQAKLTNGSEPFLFLSFKEVYQAMKAIDNVGWGFSEENGALFIRVEPWEWFYKNEVILALEDVANVRRVIDAKKVYSRLKIGYSKYADIEELNAIDTFHTERNYSNGLKAIDNQLEQMCKFVADPYAIEFTRRKALDNDTKDWKYDNEVFIIALTYKRNTFLPGLFGGWKYGVDVGIEDTDNTIISPDTIINERISPLRNASRWASSLFGANNTKLFSLTSGVGNITAKGKPISKTDAYYLADSANENVLAENGTFEYVTPKLRAEILEFEYPISADDYLKIKQSPYGKISVNGELCYVKSVEYNFVEGMGNFKLIPCL